MRSILLLVGISLLFSSCRHKVGADAGNTSSDSTFVLTGKIQGLDSGTLLFVHRAGDDKVYDTVAITKGAFELKGKITEGMTAYNCFVEGKDDDRLELLLANGTITLAAKADSLEHAVITGSKPQADYDLLKEKTKAADAGMDRIAAEEKAADEKGTLKEVEDSLDKIYMAFDSVKQVQIAEFAKANPKSLAAAYAVSRSLLIEPKVEILEPIYAAFDSTVQQSKFGKTINESIVAIRKTAIGQEAPEFTMNDLEGKPVTLSSTRGKIVLVDFWASWCGPCRRENPNVVKAYAKFHPKGLEILGVSLDKDKDKWLEAIQKDKLTWNHVSDLKGWGNQAAKTYGIRAIPANVLLDKDGKILAKNLRGEDLVKKLAEVVK